MRHVFISLLTALLLAAPVAADEVQGATAERTVPSVTVAAAAITPVQARVPVSGTLVARQQVLVFPQVTGLEIRRIDAETGDVVAKGAVLAQLATETLSAQLAQAEAEYQRAEAGVGQARSNIESAQASLTQAVTALERARRLQQGGNASQAALDQAVAAEASARAAAASAVDGLAVAQAALAQADAARRIARLNMDRARIVAPVAGIVVARNAELGALSGGSVEPLFTLIADGAIEMEAEVIETALGDVSVGDPAEMTVAGLGQVEGEVRLVPASVDPVTRLGLMRIALQPRPGLRIGTFASGWVITARRDAVTVPASAVLSDASGDRVQVVREGRVGSRKVKAGLLWQDRREIVDGLADGEIVMARSGAFFRDGDQVRAVSPAPTDGQPAGALDRNAAPNETASVDRNADGTGQP
ncbi:efflux RND transporter periplasmic adaptor subunit [Paracoccus salsus]|uniref:efflux RND transporter periplasmic adaptor subunit n=1 Tax=Paracoccus salsus TaxID=2911061 RepID=UPI001F2FD475|nr:efflux RND transporter periplasmic adaptor subunit [Paracoccus salsus]MCF3972838.1 efflux RND transporter periplasmic adaptor subunit [Paracoccus salsus]